jgi:hypothetical protein
VDSTGEDAAQHNPQKRSRAELRSHDGPDDGTYTRDIKELDEENAPGLHRHIVDAIGHGGGRCSPLWVGTKQLFNKFSINEIAENEYGQSDEKGSHRFACLIAAKLQFLKNKMHGWVKNAYKKRPEVFQAA